DAGPPLLDEPDDPRRKIADVDELDEALGRPGREDLAAAGEPLGPVREPVGGVVRPDDQAGPHDERSSRKLALGRALAQRLQPAVVLVLVTQLLDRLVLEPL